MKPQVERGKIFGRLVALFDEKDIFSTSFAGFMPDRGYVSSPMCRGRCLSKILIDDYLLRLC